VIAAVRLWRECVRAGTNGVRRSVDDDDDVQQVVSISGRKTTYNQTDDISEMSHTQSQLHSARLPARPLHVSFSNTVRIIGPPSFNMSP